MKRLFESLWGRNARNRTPGLRAGLGYVFAIGVLLTPIPIAADTWMPWEDLGGADAGTPSATRTIPNRLDVFGVNSAHHLQQRTLISPGSWSDWSDLQGAELTSKPSAL